MNRLYKMMTDVWAMRTQDFDSLMTLMAHSLSAGGAASALQILSAKTPVAAAVPLGASAAASVAMGRKISDPTIPDGSVALIQLYGALCSWESDWLVGMISSAVANPRICGIVLDIDGPGGMTTHIDRATAAVRYCPKPVAAVVSGMMASAHFWIGTAARRTFMASPLCEAGCVGVIIRYQSYKGLMDKLGITSHEVYASGADLKNRELRDLEDKGDTALLQERADYMHRVFCDTVSEHLGIPYDPELPLYRGQMFRADEAIKLGYIDQWGDVDEAVRWVVGTAASEINRKH